MVKAWKEKVVIPTYEVGKPEKNPIFLEKRVYQGSSGVVYPRGPPGGTPGSSGPRWPASCPCSSTPMKRWIRNTMLFLSKTNISK